MNTKSQTVTPTTVGPGVSRTRIETAFGFPDVAGQALSAEILNAGSPCYLQALTLASGNQTITPPTGAAGVAIILPVSNTVLVKIKGVNGDTGVSLHKVGTSLIWLDATMTTFVLNAAAEITGVQLLWL